MQQKNRSNEKHFIPNEQNYKNYIDMEIFIYYIQIYTKMFNIV